MFRLALSLRYLMLFASLGSLLGALLMFWAGGVKLVRALEALLAGGQEDYIGTTIMRATDSLLFGIVLLVFAYSIAFGFVFDLSETDRQRLPGWMRIQGIHELKSTLVQVILVYLIVDFATDLGEPGTHLSWETLAQMLAMPLAILLLAGALRLMSGPVAPRDP